MAMRRVIDSNPRPVGSSGVGSPTDAFNPTPIPGVVQQFGRVGVSSLPLHPLRFRATGPFFLFQKSISLLSRDPLPLGVQAIAFERTKCSYDHIKRKPSRCSGTL